MTIVAARPSVVPRWASVSPGTTRLAPSAGQMNTGWTNGQRPPYNVANWLQGVMYDWQQYLEAATDQLEASKINKTGASDLSGTFAPAATNTGSLGENAKRWEAAHIKDISLYGALVLGVGGVVAGNLIPNVSSNYALGASYARWTNLFLAGNADIGVDALVGRDVTVGRNVAVEGNIVPSALTGPSGTQAGANARPLSTAVARVIGGTRVYAYDKTQPSGPSDLFKLSAAARTLGQGSIVTGHVVASPTMGALYNGALERVATGQYKFTFTHPFASANDYVVMFSHRMNLAFRECYYSKTASSFTVSWFSDTARAVAADTLFDFVVSGTVNGSDPILP